MTQRSIFANLVRNENGAFSTVYGPFALQSALQPIFRNKPDTGLQIEALEGLVRVSRDGEAIAPGDFFRLVAPADIADTDSLLRTLHILNTGRLNRTHARVFVKFHPGLFRTPQEMRQEVERIKLTGHEAGMGPDRIVCEISEKSGASDDIVVAFTEHMRAMGFGIAIDDYGAGDADLARLKRIALLRVLIGQMLDDGIEPIFEGLEEIWQLDLCEEVGVPLMQGYALARPELAPTTFNNAFPESFSTARPRHETAEITTGISRATIAQVASPIRPTFGKPARAFGRRQG